MTYRHEGRRLDQRRGDEQRMTLLQIWLYAESVL